MLVSVAVSLLDVWTQELILQEMQNLLKSFAQYGDLQRVDSLVVVILSHGGGDGVIYGTDGNSRNREPHKVVRDENIMDIFSAKNCPFMAQKPKLFIIQACRGRKLYEILWATGFLLVAELTFLVLTCVCACALLQLPRGKAYASGARDPGIAKGYLITHTIPWLTSA